MTRLPSSERKHLTLLLAYAFVLFGVGLWWGLPRGAATAAPLNNEFTWTGDATLVHTSESNEPPGGPGGSS